MSALAKRFSLILGLALALPGAALAQIRGTGSNGGAIPANPLRALTIASH